MSGGLLKSQPVQIAAGILLAAVAIGLLGRLVR